MRSKIDRETRAADMQKLGLTGRGSTVDQGPSHSPLREARRRAGLTQAELAERAVVPLRTVQRMEQAVDGFGVKLATVYRLAWVLGAKRIGEIVDEGWITWNVDGQEPKGPPPEL